MREIAGETVGNVDSGRGQGAQRPAGDEPGRGAVEPREHVIGFVFGQGELASRDRQTQTGVAEGSGDVDMVTRTRAAAPQGCARRHVSQGFQGHHERAPVDLRRRDPHPKCLGGRREPAAEAIEPCAR